MQKNVFEAMPHGQIPGSNAYVLIKDQDYVVFPNPIDQDLYVKVYSASVKDLPFKLYDASGRMIYQESLHVEKGINQLHLTEIGSQLTPGIYQIHRRR